MENDDWKRKHNLRPDTMLMQLESYDSDRRYALAAAARHVAFAAAVILVAATAAAADGFRYQDYRPDTIERALTDNPHDQQFAARYNAGNFKYRVRVTALGKFRAIPAETNEFIAQWGKALGHTSAVDLFLQEVLVREGDSTYWLPIQEPLVSAFIKEVRPGELVYLYIMHAGSIESRQIFIVNEFDVSKSPN